MLARLLLGSMLLAAMGFCTADDKKEEKKKDQDLIQGEWVVEDSTIPSQIGKKLTLEKDAWTNPAGRKFTFKLDDGKKPKQLTLTRAADGTKFLAIYKIENDKLTFCREKISQGIRPTEFKASPANDLVVLKRASKPTSQQSPSAAPDKKPAP